MSKDFQLTANTTEGKFEQIERFLLSLRRMASGASSPQRTTTMFGPAVLGEGAKLMIPRGYTATRIAFCVFGKIVTAEEGKVAQILNATCRVRFIDSEHQYLFELARGETTFDNLSIKGPALLSFMLDEQVVAEDVSVCLFDLGVVR
jgi:hypothetical protein